MADLVREIEMEEKSWGSSEAGVESSSERKPIVKSTTHPKYGSSEGGGNDSSVDSSDSEGLHKGIKFKGNQPAEGGRMSKFQSILYQIRYWRKPDVRSKPRTIYFLQPDKNREMRFCSNRISTTKYNAFTFIFRFLFDQFRRYANLFFLFIALLQQIPGVSPTGRYTTIVPLTLVLLATAVKEIIEDFRRYVADNQVNYSKVEVLCRHRENGLSSPNWEEKTWTTVQVGDIVKVKNKEFFPADLLLLSSSDTNGICYVETSNLDGETNLKIRQAHEKTAELTVGTINQCEGWHVECEGPNSRLYEFTGNVHVFDPETKSNKPYPLQADKILLRGAQLRNTASIMGLVLYTGKDSKLGRNTTRAPLKRSRMDHVINYQVIALFVFLIILAVLSSLSATVWNTVSLIHLDHWYLHQLTTVRHEVANFFKSIVTFVILYNNLVPISLIVTLEIMKIVQALFINYDLELYHKETDTRALARNSNLNEELGQVKYVFSDKTGTLTENIMIFKHCFVGHKVYSLEAELDPCEGTDLKQALKSSTDNEAVAALEHFVLVLALCHTVIPEVENDEIVYRASSPDEEALVKAAKEVGVVFKARSRSHIVIEVREEEHHYEVLNLLEFNSTRKRMSVVVRMPDGKLKLFCKGADSVIYERLADGQKETADEAGHQLERFAVNGLRTLCVAEKDIDEVFFEQWTTRYAASSVALVGREEALDAVAEEIEKDLVLLGATAIEDKLQEGVPEAIAALKEAGMKVWVLTGDKQETAINIGFACHQLTENMAQLIIEGECEESVGARLQEYAQTYTNTLHGVDKESNAAMIINGKTLSLALTEANEQHFLNLALSCKSVICCRVSPLQKAQVVQLVQKKCKKEVTLAIGDGANDVGMILAAHIGVGISGREGLQATLASDYAIAQFRFLVRLLLVHGAWNYNRQAVVTLFSFYKNIVLYIIEFWFAFFNGFSGQPLFERWTIALYNVLFTACAPFCFGFFEQDLPADVRMECPPLYKYSQRGKNFNARVFWKWVGFALYHSVILFFGVCMVIPQEVPFGNGEVVGLWYVGNIVYTSVVITVNLKLALESHFWPVIYHVSVWGSILCWFLFVLVYSHFWPTFPVAVEMVGIDFKLYGSFLFYCMFLLLPTVALFLDVLMTVIQKVFFPSEIDKERLSNYTRNWPRLLRPVSSFSFKHFNDRDLSVSYSASDRDSYGDSLHGEDSVPLVVAERKSRGYAFAQEDHDNKSKGTQVQRRTLIKMYGSSN